MKFLILKNNISIIGGYAFKSKDFSDKGYPVIKIKNIQNKRVTITGDTQHIPFELATEKLNKFRLESDDILIAMTGQGSVGRVGRLYIGKNEVAPYLNQRVGKLLPNSQYLNKDYLYYLLSSSEYEKHLFSLGTGSGQPNLSPTVIKSIKIPLPDTLTQQKIAATLRALDDKIANNKAMNQTLEKLAQRIFKSWFIDFDPVKANKEGLPFDGLSPEIQALFPSEFEDSELGMIPKGWEVGKISTVSKVSSGKRPPQKVDAQDSLNNIPVWGGNGIKWYTNSTLTDKPFIITGRVGTLGTVYKVFDKVWVSDNALMLSPEKELFDYLFHALKGFDLHSLNSGSTQPLITQTAVKNIPLILPSEDILIKFQSIMDSLNEKRIHNEKSSECLCRLRDRLLPKLISGQISVGEVAQELAEAV